MKLRLDSSRMAVATISDAITTMGEVALGRICVRMMRGVDSPAEARGGDEVALAQGQELAAHRARHRRP